MEQLTNSQGANVCKCPHHKMLPLLAIAFAALFFLGRLDVLNWDTVNFIWPLLVATGAFTKLGEGNCKCCDNKCSCC